MSYTINEATDCIKGFPNMYNSRLYFYYLEEAADFIKDHKNDQEFSLETLREIARKAICPYFPFDDSTEISNMRSTNTAFSQYKKDEDIFIKRAFNYSK